MSIADLPPEERAFYRVFCLGALVDHFDNVPAKNAADRAEAGRARMALDKAIAAHRKLSAKIAGYDRNQKPVQRVTELSYMVLFPGSRKKARKIVARIDKGDIIRFRELRRRQWYDLNIDVAFSLAVKCAAGFRICMVPDRAKRK